MDFEKIDRNFQIRSVVREPDVVFRDVRDTPAGIFGLHDPRSGGAFRRLPEEFSGSISPALDILSQYPSGGRCRFLTDSAYVAIRADQHIHREKYGAHMTFLGAAGFDLYIRQDDGYTYGGSLIPPTDRKDGFEAILSFPDRKLRDITLNFPLYDHLQGLYLGLQQDAVFLPPPAYSVEKPVVFYGNSVTQGGCASRPGTCYAAILSRRLDFDYFNFGFSGNGLGEPVMAQYLTRFDAAAFVMDYDYNAPNAAHLEKTHWEFYRILREARPQMPILIMPACRNTIWEGKARELKQRRDVIRATYDRAVAAGDRKVWWLESSEIFRPYGGMECTVDGLHPTDLGFWAMANAIEPILRQMLQGAENN